VSKFDDAVALVERFKRSWDSNGDAPETRDYDQLLKLLSDLRPVPKGRANTPAKKGDVVATILAAWNEYPHQRLGQLIQNAMYQRTNADLFNIEDQDLADVCTAFVGKEKP
jgi:hypothetical protein